MIDSSIAQSLLKRDLLGTSTAAARGDVLLVIRDTRRLAGREARALQALTIVSGVPDFENFDGRVLVRRFLPGKPLYKAEFDGKSYFSHAFALLRAVHRHGVAHNDLAKEANWICGPGNRAGIVDFQLALVSRRRGKLFRLLAREDLRHLLKHKRHYCPELLTRRERSLLDTPSTLSKAWRLCIKAPYLFVTRRILRWPERAGPEERQFPPPRRSD
jgi:hypothetical protein